MQHNAQTTIGCSPLIIGLGTIGIISGCIEKVSISIGAGVEQIYPDGVPAWTARGPWQPITAGHLRPLVDEAGGWEAHLVVVPLPKSLWRRGHSQLVGALARTTGHGDQALAVLIRDFRVAFQEALADLGFAIDNSGPADLVVSKPSLQSTAYDYESDRLVGLHIDNHQAMPLAKRDQSYTLANLNIGWVDRFLTFIPYTVRSLLAFIREKEDSPRPPREIKDAFLAIAPDTPVLRVTIPPGTAYLLNTQNCIHDGSTKLGDVPDVAFLMLGNPL